MKRMKLTKMNQSELQKREMDRIRGGNDGTPCACGCAGPSSTSDNGRANYRYGYGSTKLPGGICACHCGSYENISTGGDAIGR